MLALTTQSSQIMLSENDLNLPYYHSKNELELYKACCPDKGISVDLHLIQTLLNNGANPNACFESALFPIEGMETGKRLFPLLHLIAGKPRSVDIAKHLIKAGADLSQTDSCIHNTPLLTAIAMSDRDLAAYYITTIYESRDVKVLETLSQKDTGIECQNTPIILALKKGRNDIAIMLIESGSDVNVLGRERQSALHWACMLRENKVIAALLEHGANTDAENDYGHTPSDYYHYQIKYIDIANPFIIYPRTHLLTANMREFSDLYFHVYQHSTYGLINRIKGRNFAPVDEVISQILITGGTSNITLEERHQSILAEQFDGNKKMDDSLSARFIPDQSIIDDQEAYYDIVNECTEEITLQKTNGSLLGLAVKKGHKEKIELHLKEQSLINAQDLDGFTALYWAAMRRNNDQIKLLIAHGANPSIQNKYGRTPIDYYVYQIRGLDFSSVVYNKREMDFLIKRLAPGDGIMPEFCESHFTKQLRVMGAKKRNRKPLDPSLFDAPIAQISEITLPLIKDNQTQTNLKAATSTMPGFSQPESVKPSVENIFSSSDLPSSSSVKKPSSAPWYGLFSDPGTSDKKQCCQKTHHQITKNVMLEFSNKGSSLGVSMSLYINEVKSPGLFVDEKMQQHIITLLDSPEKLITYLQTQGESASKIAGCIDSDLKRALVTSSYAASSSDTSAPHRAI